MGCLIGGFLARAGADVVLVDPWLEHVEALGREGLRLWEGEEPLRIPVRAAVAGTPVRPADLVLLLVKAPRTGSALPELPPLLAEGGAVLTLQNGLGAADLLAEALGEERVLVGVTAQGATLLGPGEIRHGGAGETLVGGYRGGHPALASAVRALDGAGLPTRAVEDIWPKVWGKLVVNCGINALTALAGLKNGDISRIPAAADVLRDAVREATAVARAAGVELGDADALAERVLAVAEATAANRSSMGQDVDRRSPTEIDFINGAVVREGLRLGVETPVNRTLTRLVQALETAYRGAPA